MHDQTTPHRTIAHCWGLLLVDQLTVTPQCGQSGSSRMITQCYVISRNIEYTHSDDVMNDSTRVYKYLSLIDGTTSWT